MASTLDGGSLNGSSGVSPLASSILLKQCDVGLRRRTYCILSGSVLTVWPQVEKQIPAIQNTKLQIVRLKTDDGKKYIGKSFAFFFVYILNANLFFFLGPMVPPVFVNEVRNCLQTLSATGIGNSGDSGAGPSSAVKK